MFMAIKKATKQHKVTEEEIVENNLEEVVEVGEEIEIPTEEEVTDELVGKEYRGKTIVSSKTIVIGGKEVVELFLDDKSTAIYDLN
jgi:uncharacterized protein YjgD (DUF1641 family)